MLSGFELYPRWVPLYKLCYFLVSYPFRNPAKVRHSKSVGILKLLKMEEVIKHESK